MKGNVRKYSHTREQKGFPVWEASIIKKENQITIIKK